jgi:hypothetical protein
MKLDQQSINSFKQAYQEEYGIMLDDGEANELAHRFYAYMDAAYQGRNMVRKYPVKYSFNTIK